MASVDPASIATVESLQWSVPPGERPRALPIAEAVVTEEPLEIRLVYDGTAESVSVTMRTPESDAELAAGFLFSEGILSDRSEIVRIVSHRDRGEQIVDVHTRRPIGVAPSLRRQFLTSSSCGVCGRSLVQGLFASRGGPVESSLTVSPARLVELPRRLRARQRLFERTGGLHAAGLFEEDGSSSGFAEDVGRHNAVDKVVGRRFLGGTLPAARSVLQVSGRVSFEIVQKAAAAGVPVVSAVSAPSSLALSAADRLGVTLVAFVREDRLNLYTHPERVTDTAGPPGLPP